MSIADSKNIHIAGAGLVGALLSIFFARQGYKVSVFEKRSDPRKSSGAEGRSINLALSHRGIKALALVGLDKKVLSHAIPMKGRMVHDKGGNTSFSPYGREGQNIYSISRNELNKILVEEAEVTYGVEVFFDHKLDKVDLEEKILYWAGDEGASNGFDVLIGADGAFSQVRHALEQKNVLKSEVNVLEHGYKELPMPPAMNGGFSMDSNALHIWPREQFMLIALPNTDKSFTCTLFLAEKGDVSFENLKDPNAINRFFKEYFPDVLGLIPDLADKFLSYPVSTLTEIKVTPWNHDHVLLIGDAAHAIVPFYGQGMNAGFEDCRLLMDLLEEKTYEGWDELFAAFQDFRKKDADGIADLAMHNFVEMRDLVDDEAFLLRKKAEAILHQLYADRFLPLYTMVTFTDIPYAVALDKGKQQDKVIDMVLDKYQNPEELLGDMEMQKGLLEMINNHHK
jgi:kynurenine 3-monooxygenase